MSEPTPFATAKCHGCSAVVFFTGRPEEDQRDLERFEADGFVIETHPREDLEKVRPTLGPCTCDDLLARIESLESEAGALRDVADAARVFRETMLQEMGDPSVTPEMERADKALTDALSKLAGKGAGE